MSSPIRADRQQFIDCVNGALLTRNEKGQIVQLGDGASGAVEAAERGEEVVLTVNGVDYSKIVDRREIRLPAP